MPKLPQRATQTQRLLPGFLLYYPSQCLPQVIVFVLQPSYPGDLLCASHFWFCPLRQREKVLSMATLCHLCLAACLQPLQPIFADRLQHCEAWLLAFQSGLLQQALVDKRCHYIQHLVFFITVTRSRADGLRRFYCAATGENGEALEELLLLGI